MSIREELAGELRDAIKTRDQRRRDVIRQIETEVARARTEPGFRGDVDDTLYRSVIASYTKKMEKARSEYLELGERGTAMAEKLGFEVQYLSRWLPRRLGEEETRELILAAIAELGVEGNEKAIGQVTGHLMRSSGADLDGAMVNRLVREILGGG